MVALRGEADVPPSRAGLSSLTQLYPAIGFALWRGRAYRPRTILITNLFNHRQTPVENGWSVRKTQVEDFRGERLTYDSHNGTDFAIPVGTPVVAPAAGRVVRVANEYNRGGLKIFMDHGEGLMTNCAHLARALVAEGARVRQGELIAYSGYSGLDGLFTFPFGVPHVHFNVWLNGFPVDPFARAEETSMWRGGSPAPQSAEGDGEIPVSGFAPQAVEALVASCKTLSVRRDLEAIEPLADRAAQVIIGRNYYPTRFDQRIHPYAQKHPRRECLDAPFLASDFDAVVFVDELQKKRRAGASGRA